ncbi:MAG: hypothetical protein MZU84_01360, partial [Sphingobacterium sp.]|nr:hypothetical protein [Sphingobacterium sp.]
LRIAKVNTKTPTTFFSTWDVSPDREWRAPAVLFVPGSVAKPVEPDRQEVFPGPDPRAGQPPDPRPGSGFGRDLRGPLLERCGDTRIGLPWMPRRPEKVSRPDFLVEDGLEEPPDGRIAEIPGRFPVYRRINSPLRAAACSTADLRSGLAYPYKITLLTPHFCCGQNECHFQGAYGFLGAPGTL